MVIISLCGFAGSGKDTIADILVEKYGFVKISFASALKDVISNIFGWDRKMLEGSTNEDRIKRDTVDEWWSVQLEMTVTPRIMMQKIGTDLFRNQFNPNIWIKIVERQLSLYQNIIITDCRFPNEINMIKSRGGKLIHVDRNKPEWFDNYKNGSDLDLDLHVSEILWIREEFSCTIENNGTIEELIPKIVLIINESNSKS